MIETTFKLAQKAALRIKPAHDNHPSFRLMEFLQGIIYDHIRKEYAFEVNWERFCAYYQEETSDQTKRVQTAIIYDETNGQPQKWAMKLTYRDSFVRRRKWQLHLGIEMKDAKTAIVYYALMYCDHMAGSFSTLKPPVITPPALLLSLNQNPRIMCCSGSFQLPFGAIAIDENNLQTALSIMLDSARELPVVLITCPDLVSPATAERMLIGNAIVCWVDDMNLLDSINAALSPQIYVEWDSIQIMLPQMAEQSQHLCFGVTEVSRLGGNRILSLLRQAYCESLRGDDRRAFVTVDDIFRQRDKQLSASLQKRLIDALAECNRLSADNTTSSAENGELRQQNATLSSKEQRQDISSYESLLSESMEQYDRLREGVLNLTQRLYGSIGQDFVPSESGEACLCDLERSIFINLAAKQGKK